MEKVLEIKTRAEKILQKLALDEKRKKIRELEAESIHPSFWQDRVVAGEKMRELSILAREVEKGEEIKTLLETAKYQELERLLVDLELFLYLSGPYDKNNAILSIHAGQGGVDAMDWAQMLLRMYTRYFERKEWKYEVIDETLGDEAGIKSAVVVVGGDYAYGYLKGEQGTHRLVRLSPFSKAMLRHTSFALVEVLPEIQSISGIEITDRDLEWEFFRASSRGGQNVQKVSTAVRLRHVPTGIVVTCQTERYQAQNRENALKILRVRLWAREMEEKRAEEEKLKGEYKLPVFGNQIRSYVLHPYKMVKDLRTNLETAKADDILNGNIDSFIEAELRAGL